MPEQLLDAWQVAESGYPADGSPAEKLRFLVQYAVLAPSGHNAQPWQFRLVGDQLEVRADRTRALKVVDPDDRELTISCGAALGNLRIALRRFGYAGAVTVLPDPNDADLLARLDLGEVRPVVDEDIALFAAIPQRRTNRMPFDPQPLVVKVVDDIRKAAQEEGVWLHILQGEDVRNSLADLIAEGDQLQGEDPDFRKELAAWIHPNGSKRKDGMPGSAFGMGDFFSYLGPLVIRTFDWGAGQAARDRQLAAGSPMLAVLGTAEDTPAAWIAAGQALAFILLRLRVDGASASYLNQPVEIPELRVKLRAVLGRAGYPQLVLRMGYGREVNPAPRRGVEEVLQGTE